MRLNIQALAARMLTLLKSREQSHSKISSESADGLKLLTFVSVKLVETHVLSYTCEKMAVRFTIISNIRVTARVSIN